MSLPPFHVLIVAAGVGERFGGDVPKQYQLIDGKSVLYHSVKSFLSCDNLKSICVLIHPDHENLYQEAFDSLVSAPDCLIGGKTRKESVFNGLESLGDIPGDEIVLIHDGARPMVSKSEIDSVVERLKVSQACSLATPISDTLCRASFTGIDEYIERDQAFNLQTPQGFHAGVLRKAHRLDSEVTDDTSLVRQLGVEVALVHGSKRNIKITTAGDLKMVETLMNNNVSMRTGLGFDVHAFEEARSDRTLMLCGIEVEHDLALAGHSDADVGLHAITDAFLGAISGGDIGDHFPPSDDQYKDADSAKLLEGVLQKYRPETDFMIENIDITLICEKPKIGRYKTAMKKRVADICAIDENQVNIKATTTERLGFTGRGEGIAAQAVVTLRIWGND